MENNLIKILERFTQCSYDSHRKIEDGVMTVKYLVTGTNARKTEEKYVVRVFADSRKHVLNYEPQVLEKLREKKIKTAALIGTSNDFKVDGLNYIIYKYLPGRPLNEVYDLMKPEDKNKLIKEIIASLFEIHKIQCENYGPLTEGFKGRFDSWYSFLSESFVKGKPYINKNTELKKSLINNFEASFPLNEDVADTGLVWLDFHPENIIVNDSNRLEGFIDFEEMVSGDLKMALGYLFAREGSSDFFHRVYKEYCNQDESTLLSEIEEYAVLRISRIAPHLKSDLPSGKKRDALFKVFKGIKELNSKVETEFEQYKSFIKRLFLITDDLDKTSNNRQKIRAAVSLFWFSILITVLFLFLFVFKLDSKNTYSQYWNNTDSITIDYAKAPIWFKYQKDTLYTDVVITDAMKLELYALVHDTVPKSNTYFKEINSLTFNSRQDAPITIYVIIGCGLLAVLGVNIRSMWNFVGNASYKNTLIISRWWPWYFLRPFIGFMAGVSFYFLFYGGVLDIQAGGASISQIYLLLGLSAIIGFGLNDFIERLRLISKAMFGNNSR